MRQILDKESVDNNCDASLYTKVLWFCSEQLIQIASQEKKGNTAVISWYGHVLFIIPALHFTGL